MLLVHIDPAPADCARKFLEEALVPGIKLSCGPRGADQDTGVLVCGHPTRRQLSELPNVRVLVVPHAGVPGQTRDLLLATRPDIAVFNLHHNAAAAAEMAIALLLAAARGIIPADAALRRGDWRGRYALASALILEGKTALILGLGAVGSRVAAACHALGMTVHAVRRNPDKYAPSQVVVHSPSSLMAILPIADVVVACLPLTPATLMMIGDRELRALRSSAVLVNVARAEIIDEAALFAALFERRIAAAGIDVWPQVPSDVHDRDHTLPSRFPFHELSNVVMTPHLGGALGTQELERRRMQALAAVLNAIARGGAVPHQVDLRAGY